MPRTRFFPILLATLSSLGFLGQRVSAAVVHVPEVHFTSSYDRQLDLNGDGLVDFRFETERLHTTDLPSSESTYSFQIASSSNAIVRRSSGTRVSLAFLPGEQITLSLAEGESWWVSRYGISLAAWTNTLNSSSGEYLWSGWQNPAGQKSGETVLYGLRFTAADGEHLAWLRIELQGSSSLAYARVVDYAYETEAGRAITAGAVPEPASIVLALWSLLLCGGSRARAARK